MLSKLVRVSLMVFLLQTTTNLVFATEEGGEFGPGNGGDLCENRIQLISHYIEAWIIKGGAERLEFINSGATIGEYTWKMLKEIDKAVVICTSNAVGVGSAEKTCKNFKDESNNSIIKCNYERFNRLSDSEQYKLIHHEYAGLAGLEVNDNERSNYVLSNQISGSLTKKTITVLAVNPEESKPKCAFVDEHSLLGPTGKGIIYKKGYTYGTHVNFTGDANKAVVLTYKSQVRKRTIFGKEVSRYMKIGVGVEEVVEDGERITFLKVQYGNVTKGSEIDEFVWNRLRKLPTCEKLAKRSIR